MLRNWSEHVLGFLKTSWVTGHLSIPWFEESPYGPEEGDYWYCQGGAREEGPPAPRPPGHPVPGWRQLTT